MKSSRRALCGAVAAAALAAAAGPAAWAQSTYPDHALHLIVPFAPGGGTDLIARLVGRKLGDRLGQAVVVDNRPGASAMIGAEAEARSAPDGYTLLMATTSVASNGSLYKNVPYDMEKDFAPISMLANAPAVLVVNPQVPAKTLAEFVSYARQGGHELNYASYGVGTAPHLTAELFQQSSGTRLFHVPYKGGGPAVLATLSGETKVIFPSAVPVMTHLKSGKLRALAVASHNRLASLPDVPTFHEAGMDFETGTWFGIVGRAGTPAPIIDRLHREIVEVLKDPELRKAIEEQGAEVLPSASPAEYAKFISADIRRWAEVVKKAHITVEQ
ncbi:tripartite tricarboxylate transporter substrate binding protein [Pigmentiphaga soli]|uniref:Tripartite tricarboxylate transporter substrate binding protein n=1 Tax=Pigmentiphaga soli TaxID=1007095 RepID=A0ABP8GT78_9BURK